MRSTALAAFLLSSLGFSTVARAHVPLVAPRVSLSLALDWNSIAATALRQPRHKPVAAKKPRHTIPRLTVTSAAPLPPQRDLAAYGRVESWVRDVAIPHYVEPDVDHRQMFRQLYVTPYSPYIGAYGLVLTIETDAVLR
ncbi:MAG TPA: hypothetical protein VN947_30930 [Polyangia bacterium]|nr:hypothetical protein [Polyangia bacterium]